MDLTLYLSILFFFSGINLLVLGAIGRIRISKLSSDYIPEFNFFEYIELKSLLMSYYNSVIILGVPFSCLGLTITYNRNAFIVNSVCCIVFLIYTYISHRKLLNKLMEKDLKLKTLRFRLKNMELYKVERLLAERNIPFKVHRAIERDREQSDVKRKVA